MPHTTTRTVIAAINRVGKNFWGDLLVELEPVNELPITLLVKGNRNQRTFQNWTGWNANEYDGRTYQFTYEVVGKECIFTGIE